MENIEEDSKLDFSKWPKTDPLQQPLSFNFHHINNKKEIITSDSDSDSVNSPNMNDNPNNNNNNNNVEYQCLICDYTDNDSKTILEHLCFIHKLVIADVNSVANLASYLEFWKKKMAGKELTEYTSCIQTQPTPSQPVTNYYLLSDILPEDLDLRKKLQTERLSTILAQQHIERSDPNFTSHCPMCQTEFKGDRSAVVHHLYDQHNFNIGLADNIFNLNELLGNIQEKIDNNQCLYCEKVFKSTSVLKLHMKKKKHHRLNPMNTGYDRFYLLNYLEPGKNWEELKKEDQEPDQEAEQQLNNVDMMKQAQLEMNQGTHVTTQWDDWTEDSEDGGGDAEDDAICLFCERQCNDSDETFTHMSALHRFNFEELRKSWKLDYYDSVKLLNFIRRQVHQLVCPYCGEKHDNANNLFEHINSKSHAKVAQSNPLWKDPQYLFPTYENDSLLRNFEDFDEEENEQYLQEERIYQSNLMDEMIQNRNEILKQLNDNN